MAILSVALWCAPYSTKQTSVMNLGHVVLCVQVLMKDVMTPAPPEEVRAIIKKCLENAALVNYTRISEQARLQGLLAHSLSRLLSVFSLSLCFVLCGPSMSCK